MNYLEYPFAIMTITQNYNGTTSHTKYSQGNPKSYPWDEAGKDTGRDWFLCPCDEVVISRIYTAGTNTLWLQSTTKVKTPTFEDYITMKITHPNNDDMANIKVGQKFKRGERIVREGTSGGATGNHVHLEIAKGPFASLKNSGWVQNNLKAWVISGDSRKPEDCFYIISTKVNRNGSLSFIQLFGTPIKRDTTKKQVEIKVDNLRLRKTANGIILGYIKRGIYDIIKVEGTWLQTTHGWVGIGDWLSIYEPKEEPKPPIVEPIEEPIEYEEEEIIIERPDDIVFEEPKEEPKKNLIDLIIELIILIINKLKGGK